ncbi:MAG: hypothetical protein AAF378_17380 [Cyanobacteria bacterium P01_A01_bin.84]
MIISDLNYLETSTEEVLGGNYNFKKNISSTVDTNITFDSKTNVDKDVNVDVAINAKANIKGNIADLQFDVEAVGDDSFTEVEASVLTTDGLSSIAGAMYSAVG